MACGAFSGTNALLPGIGMFMGDDGKKKKQTGGRLINKGNALLNAYQALLPRTLDVTAQGAAGFGDIYRQEAEKTRQNELTSFEQYGPRYVAAITGADPAQTALRARTNQIVLGNLDESLDPAVRREIQQGNRAAWSSRGLLNSPASAVEELFGLGAGGKALEQQNIQNALATIASNQRVIGDPFMAFAGRPSQPQGSNVMSPNYAGFNDDLFTYDVNSELMRNANKQAQLNRNASYINAGISAIGSIGGGALGALCWVAREVFGQSDVRWLRVRHWMFQRAPLWLFKAYQNHGEATAGWLRRHPRFTLFLRSTLEIRHS